MSNLTSTLDSAYENENGNGNGGADNENVLINVEQEDFFFEEDDNNIGNRLDIEQLQSPPSSNKNISPKMLQQLRLRQQVSEAKRSELVTTSVRVQSHY